MNRRSQSGNGWMRLATPLAVGFTLLPQGPGNLLAREGATGKETRADGGAARLVRIEAFPGTHGDVVDPGVDGEVPVAVLSDASFDARGIDPHSLSFAGAGLVKMDDGTSHRIEDVNRDGRPDLIARFSERDIRLGEGTTRVSLAGESLQGVRFFGHTTLRPAAALREAARRRPARLEGRKASTFEVGIDILPGDPINAIDKRIPPALPVAILSRAGFDAASVDPGSVQLGGSPVTHGPGGKLSEIRDVNGDGLADLLLHVQGAPLRLAAGPNSLSLSGRTDDGDFVSGTDRVQFAPLTTITFHNKGAAAPGPIETQFSSNGLITINDNAPATPYPSNILVTGTSGVISEINVSLEGLTHTFPSDLDVLLVGPTGQSLLLMADKGGGNPGVSGVTLTFDDDAPTPVPSGSNPPTGRYQPGGEFGGGNLWPAPAPAPSEATRLAAFNGTGANGVWSLYIVDDEAQDVGTLAGWSITLVMADKYGSDDLVSIPDMGIASPYPSTLTVGALSDQVISKAVVTLHDIHHTFPDDLGMLLVGPQGQSVVLMSNVGGPAPGPTNVDLTFDDYVFASLTPDVNPRSGTYRPSQAGLAPAFSAPAPPGPYSSGLSTFIGTSPQGLWRLYVQDFAGGDSGSLDGWDLILTVRPPDVRTNLTPITIPAGAPLQTQGSASPYPSTITVSGLQGLIGKTTVTLRGLTHTYPDDLDVFLLAGVDTCIPLMSDAGGSFGVSNVDLTFDQSGAVLPDAGPLQTGAYRPADYDGGDLDRIYSICGFGLPDLGQLKGYGANGDWSLYVDDDEGGDSGTLAAGWSISFELYITTNWFCEDTWPNQVRVPGGQPGVTMGRAAQYPSPLTVSGIDRPVGRVQFGIEGVHNKAQDLDLLLTGPDGTTSVVLMSDAGATDLSGVLEFDVDDAAVEPIPTGSFAFLGRYRPTNYDDGLPDLFAPPAPPPTSIALSAFTQMDPNGVWSLYAMDDAAGGYGQFDWCLRFDLLAGVPEVQNLQWTTAAGNELFWETAPEALEYRLYRGVRSDLPNLMNPNPDSCLRAVISGTTAQSIAENPPVGSMYWYVVRGADHEGEGPAGFALLGTQPLARVQDSTGPCLP